MLDRPPIQHTPKFWPDPDYPDSTNDTQHMHDVQTRPDWRGIWWLAPLLPPAVLSGIALAMYLAV